MKFLKLRRKNYRIQDKRYVNRRKYKMYLAGLAKKREKFLLEKGYKKCLSCGSIFSEMKNYVLNAEEKKKISL